MDIGFDVNSIKEQMSRIEYDLICMLEIDISNGVFVQNGMPVHIDGKSINYPKIEMNGIPDKYSINYEPFTNRKIAHMLFNRYAVILQMENPSLSIMSFFISKNLNNPNYLYATCRTNVGDYTSHPFTNESICWIDLIYLIEDVEGYNFNNYHSTFNNIDMLINTERLIQQKEKEEAKKKK